MNKKPSEVAKRRTLFREKRMNRRKRNGKKNAAKFSSRRRLWTYEYFSQNPTRFKKREIKNSILRSKINNRFWEGCGQVAILDCGKL